MTDSLHDILGIPDPHAATALNAWHVVRDAIWYPELAREPQELATYEDLQNPKLDHELGDQLVLFLLRETAGTCLNFDTRYEALLQIAAELDTVCHDLLKVIDAIDVAIDEEVPTNG